MSLIPYVAIFIAWCATWGYSELTFELLGFCCDPMYLPCRQFTSTSLSHREELQPHLLTPL